MEKKEKGKMKMKIVSLLIMICMLTNTFSPLGQFVQAVVILPNKVIIARWQPASIANASYSYFDENDELQTGTNGKRIRVQLILKGISSQGMDIRLSYDKDKIQPSIYGTSASDHNNVTTDVTKAISLNSATGYTAQVSPTQTHIDAEEGAIQFVLSAASAYTPPDLEAGFTVLTINFRVIDNSLTPDDITTNILKLDGIVGLATGMNVSYRDEGVNKFITDSSYFGYENFVEVEEEKTITNVSISKNPSTLTYEHGAAINLAGGKITVTYSDSSTEEIDMASSSDVILQTATANFANQTVNLKYKTYDLNYAITVTDPVNSIAITTPPSKTEYNNEESIELSGAVITATTKSGQTINITSPYTGVTLSSAIADLSQGTITGTGENSLPCGNQTITLTYQGKQASYTILINDTVDNIAMANAPKTTYSYGEALNLSTGSITVNTTSGATVPINLNDGSVSVTGYNPTILGSQTLTVNFMGVTTTYNVTVNDYVNGINITPPTKTVYNYGESLVLTGGTVTDAMASGVAGSTISMTSGMISGYNPNTLGIQTLTVTKGSFTKTFNITVNNYPVGIMIYPPPRTEYIYGEALDLSDGAVQIIMANGAYGTAATLQESMISGYNPNQVGQQELTVTYSGFTTTLTVTVSDETQGIEITTPPTKTSYKYGDTLDVTGGKITITKSSGAEVVDLTEDMVTGFDSVPTFGTGVTQVTQTLTVSYEGYTDTYDITVTNELQSIVMGTTPKTSYNVNEALDVTGGTIVVTRQAGATEEINITPEMVSGFDSITEGNKTLTISYTENSVTKTTTYSVIVTDSVISIAVNTNPAKTTYNYGEVLDLTGGMLDVVKGSGTYTEPMTSAISSGYNPNILGEQTVTLTLGGQTASFDVEVVDYVSDVTLVSPTKTLYNYGESLDLTNGTINRVWASGASSTAVPLTDATVSVTGYSATTLGAQTISVTYAGYTKTFGINVQDYAVGAEITTEPTKKEYKYNETLNTAGGKITVTKASGATEVIDITNGMVSGYNGTPIFEADQRVTENLTVTYGSYTDTYEVTVTNEVVSIAMGTTPKTSYNVNDILDVTGGTIVVTRQTGTPEVIAITTDMVSGFNSTTEGAKTLTVSYTENGVTKTTTYGVTVIDSVISIAVNTEPTKTTYNYGESLDLTGGILDIVRGSGPDTVAMSAAVASGYNPNTLGTQIVTLTYGGKTTTIEVEVVDYVSDITLVAPTKISYNYGETLDLTGGTVKKVWASGASSTAVALTDGEVSVTGYSATTPGTQTISVTYAGYTKTFGVTVTDTISGVEITTIPTKVAYKHGDMLDVTGGKITVTKASGATEVIDMTSGMVTGFNSSPVFDADQKVDETLTITYGGYTDTYEVTVTNEIASIAMGTTPKTSYNVNGVLDVAGGTIVVTRQTGTPEEIAITPAMVTGFDSGSEGIKTLTVSYTENDITRTTTYEITVSDSVISIAVNTNPTKTIYNYGEVLNLTGGILDIVRSSGNATLPMTAAVASGYNPNILGEQIVTLTYGGKTTTIEVEVVDYVSNIILVAPNKLAYSYGEVLDLSGGTVKKIMASGVATTAVPLTNGEVSVTGYSSTTVGTQVISVEYAGFTKTFGVTVTDPITGIEVTTNPTKTTYNYGEAFNVAGGKITVTRLSGATQEINITNAMVTGYSSTTLGEQELTVTYSGQTSTFDVEVIDYVTDIVLVAPTKLTYEKDEALDLSGGTVKKIMASGAVTTAVPLTDAAVAVTGYNSSVIGAQTIAVEYAGHTKTFGVYVNAKSVTSIEIDTLPTKQSYNYGEALSVVDGKIKVTYSDSSTEIVNMTIPMISGYNPSTLGEQTVTVTYGGKTTTYQVEVKDKIAGITVTEPTKLLYVKGEALDLTGGNVKVVMASGAINATIPLTDASITLSGYDSTKVGVQTIAVKYGIYEDSFNVTVKNDVSKLEIITLPNKTEYTYGNNIDLTGGTVKITRENGETEVLNMTDSKLKVTGFNSRNIGTQEVTVSMDSEWARFGVKVNDAYKETRFIAPTKRTYKYGEELNTAGGRLEKVMLSGKVEETIYINEAMVRGFDNKNIGTQTLSFTYESKTYTYNVEVADSINSISVVSKPTKTIYEYEEELDLTGAKISVVKDSGVETINVTPGMISGYDPTKAGEQIVTVTYEGYKATFSVVVSEKEDTTPIVSDDLEDEDNNNLILIGSIAGGTTLLLLLLLLLVLDELRKIKIIVKKEDKEKLAGREKVSKENPIIDVRKYLEKYSKDEIEIVIPKSIAKNLDGKTMRIIGDEQESDVKVDYQGEEIVITL